MEKINTIPIKYCNHFKGKVGKFSNKVVEAKSKGCKIDRGKDNLKLLQIAAVKTRNRIPIEIKKPNE